MGVFLSSALLVAVGFPQGAKPEDVDPRIVTNLALVYMPVIVVLYGLAIWFIRGYRIDRGGHEEVVLDFLPLPDVQVNICLPGFGATLLERRMGDSPLRGTVIVCLVTLSAIDLWSVHFPALLFTDWAALDRSLVSPPQSYFVPFGHPRGTTFVSDRIDPDHIVFHPVFLNDYSTFALHADVGD